jgi:N-acetylmuramoyl-L-alanine amidase
MTLNSSKAVINGKTVTMPAAPMMVKYVNKGVAKILVPSRFVAENLGYQYTWIKEKNTAAIQKKTVELSYNGGESFEYTGTLASVSIDGSSLNLGSMPSIIQNNTAMLRAKRVFADSKIGAVYKYNSSDRTITLTKNENKLEMKIGSLSGYLNGKSITLPIAPMIVRNLDTGYSFVMVPGNFTANCLGYNYYWNQSKKASEITTKTNQQGGDPELGDDGVKNEPGTILYSWKASISSTGNSSGIHEIKNNSSTSADPGFISSVARDYNTSYVNTEVFKIVSNTPFNNITSSKSDYMFKVKLSKILSGNQNFQTYGSESMLINSINTTYNPSEVSSEVVFNLLPKTLDYDLSLSSDKMTLYITVYKNTLNEVTIGSNSYGHYISLTGSEPLNVNLTALENSLLIELPYTYNRVGEQYTNLAGDQNLNFVNVLSYLEDRTQILAGFTGKADYQILENGNKYTILFPKKDTSTPGQSNDPSKYEVIIPKPQGITKSMISDEDYYYNHKFSIFLPGDYTSIITSNTITNKSSMVTGISTRLTSDNRTEIMISTSAIQGYQYYTDDNYIYVDIGNPKDIYKNIVVLDPGHGYPQMELIILVQMKKI